MGAPAVPSGTARSAMSIATCNGRPSLHKNQTMKSHSRTSLSATASFLRVQLRVGRLMQPDTTVLVPQSSVPQLGSTGVAGTLGHGTKIRYISFPDVHNLYSSLPEPKLLDHGTKNRYISVPEVPTRYRTKKYLLGTKFFVANCIKLWRINIRYLECYIRDPGNSPVVQNMCTSGTAVGPVLRLFPLRIGPVKHVRI